MRSKDGLKAFMWKPCNKDIGVGHERTLLIAALFASVTVPAIAADLPVRPPAPAPVMVPYLNWSGFYIGLNGGYSWGHSSRDLNFFNPLNGVTIATGTGSGRDLNGGVFGGQIGYNWQAANWVFGIEADAQWTGQKGGTTVLCPVVAGCFPTALAAVPANAASATLNDKLDWFATFRGRVGVLVTPGVLLYGTGGAAWGEVETDLTLEFVHRDRPSGLHRLVQKHQPFRLDARRWHRDDVCAKLERQDRIPVPGYGLDQQFSRSADCRWLRAWYERQQPHHGQASFAAASTIISRPARVPWSRATDAVTVRT
jgi:opacity protein-like surface antigen